MPINIVCHKCGKTQSIEPRCYPSALMNFKVQEIDDYETVLCQNCNEKFIDESRELEIETNKKLHAWVNKK